MENRGKFRRIAGSYLVAWGLLFLAVHPLQAQINTGTITGFVQDPTGAMIAGAQVAVTNQDKGTSTATKSNSAGQYIVPQLDPGVYTVVVQYPGFSTATSRDNRVVVGQRLEIDFKLELGQFAQNIEVQAQAPLINTGTSNIGRVVESQHFESLPLNGRFYQDVAALMPGAVPYGWADMNENPAGMGAVQPMYMSFNGNTFSATRYLIDGVASQEPANSYQAFTPTLDAIEEIDINTSNPSAEFGNFGGGVVSASIRSGTNKWHGSLFEFLRNSSLNAKEYFSPGDKTPYNSNMFGGTVGGPIIRDRWFFFADYQGYRQALSSPSVLAVPTQLQRQGIFTEPGQSVIYDPLTHTPFENNTIPKDRINPIAAKIINLYPLPNQPGLTSNFIFVGSSHEASNQFEVKTDVQINPGKRLFVRESFLPASYTDPSLGSQFIGGGHSESRNHNAAIGLTSTISPTKVNELRFGFTRYKTRGYAGDYAVNENDILGIPGGNIPGMPEGIGGGIANIGISDIDGLGADGLATWRFSHTFDLLDNFVWQRSKHTLKFGADLQESWSTCCFNRPNGYMDFDGNFTSDNGDGGIGMASFLLGYPIDMGRNFWNHSPYMRDQILGVYFQDDFRASKKLTLNLGLRYDRIPQPVEKFNALANYDLNTGLMTLATDDNRRPGITDFNRGFGPRVGLAYQIIPKTVIRTAYGITFYNSAFGAQGGAMETTYPFFGYWAVSNPEQFVPSLSINDGFPAVMAQPTYVNSDTFLLPAQYEPNVHTIQRPAMVQMWNFGIEREFTNTLMVRANYVGNHATQMFRYKYLNLALPGPGPIADRTPYGKLGCPDQCVGSTQIIGHTSDGSSMYEALQVEAKQRLVHGLDVTASYTWSKSIDDLYVQYLNPYNDRNTRGVSTYRQRDYPQLFTLSSVYSLPVGKGQRFSTGNNIADQVVGGWRIGVIGRLHSGDPLRIWVRNSLLNNTQRNLADMVPGCKPHVIGSPNEWMDSSCFSFPPLYTWGNSGVGHVRGPGFNDWDLQAAKVIHLSGEQTRLEFTFDFLNVANHPIFSNPNTTLGSPGFGQITGTNWNPRWIQIGGHLVF